MKTIETIPTCTVEVSQIYDYDRETIWRAWVEPEVAAKFLFKTEHGKMKLVEIDARLNGSFIIIEERNGINAEHYGRYVKWDFPTELSFNFGPNAENNTSVSLFFEETGQACSLKLCHQGVWLEFEDRVRDSWIKALENLRIALDSQHTRS